MKTVAALGLTILLTLASSVHAQNFRIDWFTIDGGGGTSSGGVYTLSGTIGQPDAGRMSGGAFLLEGGFWPGAFPVQQVDAPTLFIQNSGPNVIITWDPNSPNFILQHSPSLSPAAWENVPGGVNGISIPRMDTRKFYRLRRP